MQQHSNIEVLFYVLFDSLHTMCNAAVAKRATHPCIEHPPGLCFLLGPLFFLGMPLEKFWVPSQYIRMVFDYYGHIVSKPP